MIASLFGKTALVTGAAKRLGRAICLALADEAVNVVVHYNTSAAEAQALCGELEGRGVRAWALQADLGQVGRMSPGQASRLSLPGQASRPSLPSLVTRAVELAGPLDILVNNASSFDPSRLESLTFEDFTANAAVNAWAPFVLSRDFAAQGREGAIINLLDTRVQGYDWSHVAYILSKHLLAVLTRMTALEYAPKVRVNAVAPGMVIPPPGMGDEYPAKPVASLPLQRHGETEDIAAAVVFLLKSDFVTGQVIYVDGGRHLREGSRG